MRENAKNKTTHMLWNLPLSRTHCTASTAPLRLRKKSEFLSPSPRRKITSFCFCLYGKTDVGKKTLFFSCAFLARGILLHTLLAWFQETGSRWHEWPSIIPMKLFFAFFDFFRGKASWAATKRRLRRRRMRRRTKPGGASRQVRFFFKKRRYFTRKYSVRRASRAWGNFLLLPFFADTSERGGGE